MNASCADWVSRAASCGALLWLGVACSESQYNPPIGVAGAASTRGAGGSAGQTGSAGSGTSSGGSAGTVGNNGAAGGPGNTPTEVYGFESSLEGFSINYFCTGPGAGENCTQVQAQQPAQEADAGADAGDSADAAPPLGPVGNGFITLEQDGAAGDADPGAATLTFQFGTGRQSANLAINFGSGELEGIDLGGKVVRARVRADVGAPLTAFAKMYIKTTGTYYYADSGEITLIPGVWTTLSFDTGLPPSYPAQGMLDMSQYLLDDVRELGLEIGASAVTEAASAVIRVDTISY